MTDAEIIKDLERRNFDAPPCPEGCGPIGTPSRETEQGRWYGPPEARLWCPCCGVGWYGDEAEVAKAEAAWQAYELLIQMGAI